MNIETWPVPLDKVLTTTEVVNDASETTVYSFSIPASLLGTSSGVGLILDASYLNDSGAGGRTLESRITFGGTTVWEDVTGGIGATANRRPLHIQGTLFNLAATNSQRFNGLYWMGVADTPTTGEGGLDTPFGTQGSSYGTPITGTSAVDTMSAQTLAVVMQHSVAATTISIIVRQVLLFFIP